MSTVSHQTWIILFLIAIKTNYFAIAINAKVAKFTKTDFLENKLLQVYKDAVDSKIVCAGYCAIAPACIGFSYDTTNSKCKTYMHFWLPEDNFAGTLAGNFQTGYIALTKLSKFLNQNIITYAYLNKSNILPN